LKLNYILRTILCLCMFSNSKCTVRHEGVDEGVDVKIHVILTSAVVGGELSVSRSDRFIHGEGTPFTYWIRILGWALEPFSTLWRRENS
jgi:hypothetical protein